MELLPDERVLWSGNPSWKALLLFYIKWTLISLLPVVAWLGLDSIMDDPPSATWFVLVTLLGLLAVFVGGWIKRATTRYRVTDRRIQIRTGLLSRSDSSTNLTRVQNVNVNQTAFQRLLGVGNVDWDSAGTEVGDADFTVYGVDDPSSLVRTVDVALHAGDPSPPPGL